MQLLFNILVILIPVIVIYGVETAELCPRKCNCSSDNRNISCTIIWLRDLPLKLPITAQILTVTESAILYMPADAFGHLPNLTTLHVNHCLLKGINNHAFRGLKNLQILDLSYNHLTSLQDSLCQDNPYLRELNIDVNQFKNLPKSSILNTCKSVRIFKLSNNRPLCTNFVNPFFELSPLGIVALPIWFHKLERLDYNYNCAENDVIKMLYKRLNYTWPLKQLNLRGNNITELDYGQFEKANKLQKLDLSANRMRYIAGGAFYNLEMLEELHLSDNYLHNTIGQDENGTIFNLLNKLVTVHLDGNQIKVSVGLAVNLYQLSSLKELNLANNLIAKWRVLLTKVFIPRVTFLDLSSNQFTSINTYMFKDTGNLQEINLKNNPLRCSCDLVWFINWLNTTNVTITDYKNYYCDLDGDRGLISSIDWYSQCRAPYVGVYIGLAVFFGIIICLFCGCKCRWRIRFCFHRYFGQKTNPYSLITATFPHHAYISYVEDPDDVRFVEEIFLNKLDRRENEIAGKYSFFYSKRDSEAGEHILDVLDRGITSCPCAIVILSDKYLKSGRHMMELKELQDETCQRKFPIIFATYGQSIIIAAATIRTPKWLKVLYSNSLTIHWETDDDLRNEFYKKLTSVLDVMLVNTDLREREETLSSN